MFLGYFPHITDDVGLCSTSVAFRQMIILSKCRIVYSRISNMSESTVAKFLYGNYSSYLHFGFCAFDGIFFACRIGHRDSLGRDDTRSSSHCRHLKLGNRGVEAMLVFVFQSTDRHATYACSTYTWRFNE